MIIPARTKVGPYLYETEYQDVLFGSDNTRLSGVCDHMQQRIVLDHTPAPTKVFETYIHEAVHAMDYVAGTGLDEETVTRFAVVLAAFLIDNGYDIGVRR